MSEVIEFPGAKVKEVNKTPIPVAQPSTFTLSGAGIEPPTTRKEFLIVCKKVLPQAVYHYILCAILDEDIYDELPQVFGDRGGAAVSNVVGAYYAFKE